MSVYFKKWKKRTTQMGKEGVGIKLKMFGKVRGKHD